MNAKIETVPFTITIDASHKAQVPEGEVRLRLSGPVGRIERVDWSVAPDSGTITGDGVEVRWSAPQSLQIYRITALARVGSPDYLSQIEGIGEKTQDALRHIGIDLFDALRLYTDAELRAVVANTNANADIAAWKAEAAGRAAETPEKAAARASVDIEVTPNALPLDIVDRIQEGKQALERSADALTSGLAGGVKLQRQFPPASPHKALWALIRNRTEAISFTRYKAYMDDVMCGSPPEHLSTALRERVGELRFRGTDAYDILRAATEAFLMHETGVYLGDLVFDEEAEQRRLPQLLKSNQTMAANRDAYLVELEGESTFPYFKVIRDKLKDIPLKTPGVAEPSCYGILRTRLSQPLLLELIFNYWIDEAGAMQAMKVLSLRFQNRAVKGRGQHPNPLATMNLDPLRPMSNLLWGYIQEEQHRLSVVRRAYEYDHHYGFTISGAAVPVLDPADSRTGFLEAFHTLLHRCSLYYREQADTTKVPDGYPILNGLKECHLLLAQGAHNQYGDLPWTARIEMLLEQWLLARPEIRDFLGRRTMVPYPEEWMATVDQARDLMGWKGASVRHFRDLAVFGEQILLSIRFGNWSDEFDENVAALWAQQAREAVLAYINAYRVATGVELSADGDKANVELSKRRVTPPSELLRSRVAMSKAG